MGFRGSRVRIPPSRLARALRARALSYRRSSFPRRFDAARDSRVESPSATDTEQHVCGEGLARAPSFIHLEFTMTRAHYPSTWFTTPGIVQIDDCLVEVHT